MVALATGYFPLCLRDELKKRFRGPINCRVVLESLTTTLHPTILPKLRWYTWNGPPPHGGPRGHWGWVPKDCLVKGDWQKSWSEKLRVLTVKCHDPDTGEYLGDSTFQFMSHEQDPSDFASGEFHEILHDEPPREAIWMENLARVMSIGGRMRLAMTWPDNPAIPVDWLFDRIYDPAHAGVPDYEWIELYTTENRNIDQDSISSAMAKMSEVERQVRIYGRPIRFSNLIHPDFTDREAHWCFSCKRQSIPLDHDPELCLTCGNRTVVQFCHVRDFDLNPAWPAVFALDPHPRKAHMWLWVVVDPSDDLWVVAEGASEDELPGIKAEIERAEEQYRLRTVQRLIDPNMGASPASIKRNITWQDEFSRAGLRCSLADDSDVGRSRLNEFFKPDDSREAPRIHVHPRCTQTIHQLKRYVWGEHKHRDERDIKQKPREMNDDYPTLLKYVMNANPTWYNLTMGAPVIRSGRGTSVKRRY